MSAPVKLTGEERSALAALSVEAYTFVAFAREQVKRSLAKKGLIVRGRGLSLTDAGRATLAALAASKDGAK